MWYFFSMCFASMYLLTAEGKTLACKVHTDNTRWANYFMGNATGRQCTFSCTVCHILHASILPIKYFARQGFANRILPVCSLPIVYCRLVVWQHVLCTPVFCQFAILANTYRIYYITTTPNYYTSWTAMLRYSRSIRLKTSYKVETIKMF